jgi:hypothetical protein
MTRIVIHAGFHKTGTTSVQTMLDANRRILGRRLRIYLKSDFGSLTKAARAFSTDQTPAMLAKVATQASGSSKLWIPPTQGPS